MVNQIIFSSILQTWYVELRISRSISESPLEFEITRVDCTVERDVQIIIFIPRLCQFMVGMIGWGGGVLWLCHCGVQILAYSFVRPAAPAAGKGRAGMYYFSCSVTFFISFLLPYPPLSSPLLSLLSLFSLSLGDDTKWPTMVDVSINPTQSINQSIVDGDIVNVSVRLSPYLLQNFNQICYLTFWHSKGVREQHYFKVCPSHY